MIDLRQYDVWFVTGSQHLYGQRTLEQVAEHSREIAGFLGQSAHTPVKVVFKPVLTTPEDIRRLCLEANSSDACAGLITWMHTFSPAKMCCPPSAPGCVPPAHGPTGRARRSPASATICAMWP
jgi:L-arabinose isomerase